MKYLRGLTNHNAYEQFINGNAFSEIQRERKGSVSYCKSEKHMHYNPYIPAKLLDILYSDAYGNLSYTSEILPASEGKIPIGLCIAGTKFFGTNEKARWMSLKYMNLSTPEVGSLTTNNMGFGKGADTGMSKLTKTYVNGADTGYLTANWITKTGNKIPSLFDTNNEWNLSVLGSVNQYIVTDIDGKNRTENIITIVQSQPNWRTDNHIDNQGWQHTPICCCCLRYHTLGTQAGDWYLGAGGEFSMVIVMRNEINAKLALIAEVYPDDSISSLASADFWTSTEKDSDYAYGIGTYDGGIGGINKYGDKPGIALLQY